MLAAGKVAVNPSLSSLNLKIKWLLALGPSSFDEPGQVVILFLVCCLILAYLRAVFYHRFARYTIYKEK
jgi:hypothetical protein